MYIFLTCANKSSILDTPFGPREIPVTVRICVFFHFIFDVQIMDGINNNGCTSEFSKCSLYGVKKCCFDKNNKCKNENNVITSIR